MKRTIFLMFSVLLLLILFGCSDVKDNDVTPSDTTAAITTEAPATDTTKTEETTAPPETEKTIIWASEPDPYLSDALPVRGKATIGFTDLHEALKDYDEDTVIGVAIGSALKAIDTENVVLDYTYNGKTLDEYKKIKNDANREWFNWEYYNQPSDQANDVNEAYDNYLAANAMYIEALAHVYQPITNMWHAKLEPFGFKLAYDRSNDSVREYLYICGFSAVYTISVKDFYEFARYVENTAEGYIFCYGMELSEAAKITLKTIDE